MLSPFKPLYRFLLGAERLQVGITGQDQMGARGGGGGEKRIVVRICKDGARDGLDVHCFNQAAVLLN